MILKQLKSFTWDDGWTKTLVEHHITKDIIRSLSLSANYACVLCFNHPPVVFRLQIRINFPSILNISVGLFNVLFATFRFCRFHWTSALCFRASFFSAHTQNTIWSILRLLFTFPFTKRREGIRKGERVFMSESAWDFGRVFGYLDDVLIGIFFWHQQRWVAHLFGV